MWKNAQEEYELTEKKEENQRERQMERKEEGINIVRRKDRKQSDKGERKKGEK